MKRPGRWTSRRALRRGTRLAALALVLLRALERPVAASPLQEAAAQLACGSAADVERALAVLARAPTARFGVPDESLTGADLELRSVAYDSLLDALATARRRFPELASRIDALLEPWDFCALTADDERWDLRYRDGVLLRIYPARMSPLMGVGFAAWGLIPRLAAGRPSWVADGEPSSTVALQCQPQHTLELTPSGPLPMVPEATAELDARCRHPTPPAPEASSRPSTSPVDPAALAAARPRRGGPASQLRLEEASREVASPSTREATTALPGTISAQITTSASGTVGTGVGLSVAPFPNGFARAGLGWRLVTAWQETVELEPSWSWGLGYDDWHAGTFSAQLNHWGPLRRGGGAAALRGAVANVGYKVSLPAPASKYLALRADLSTPLTWAPSVGLGLALKLPYYLFFSIGVATKLSDPSSPTWSYVLGRSQWKAGTLSVVLANYGPNQVPDLNPKGMSISVSWSWKI